ncbi:hypothetical protein K435DRAFT_872435 [Dendrothele bispora CBS 962.96]|uniref:Uncharacterized protein n=1 Tax=Dendrothele bispora (strain CBS 962.96) TaxID=1314807 RepID=A0A4S8L1K5_DENBC|nr:hypothetical protein K435DRAFT_872435 [Dendrothele bispora CBS 962.96]
MHFVVHHHISRVRSDILKTLSLLAKMAFLHNVGFAAHAVIHFQMYRGFFRIVVCNYQGEREF